jgi:hypothetical protein
LRLRRQRVRRERRLDRRNRVGKSYYDRAGSRADCGRPASPDSRQAPCRIDSERFARTLCSAQWSSRVRSGSDKPFGAADLR